jgi:hypothetical protein
VAVVMMVMMKKMMNGKNNRFSYGSQENYVHSGILLHCNMKSYYSRIPLIQHVRGQTGARLLDIVDYWTVPILTYVPTCTFLLLLLFLGWLSQESVLHPLGTRTMQADSGSDSNSESQRQSAQSI